MKKQKLRETFALIVLGGTCVAYGQIRYFALRKDDCPNCFRGNMCGLWTNPIMWPNYFRGDMCRFALIVLWGTCVAFGQIRGGVPR